MTARSIASRWLSNPDADATRIRRRAVNQSLYLHEQRTRTFDGCKDHVSSGHIVAAAGKQC